MTIDFHVHTAERSLCGNSGERDQIRAAIDAGFDAMSITDHDRLVPPLESWGGGVMEAEYVYTGA